MKLGGSTFGYLQHHPLPDALRHLAENGITHFELTPMAPHLNLAGFGAYERRSLKRLIDALGLQCVSVNPGFVDINLVSTNAAFRELSLRQIELGLELAHDLEAPSHVIVAGRRHALSPAPLADVRAVLLESIDRLLRASDGVTLVLENSPYGFMGTADELSELVEHVRNPRLRVCYDVANAIAQEDPVAGVRRIGSQLALGHVSDAWTDRWAHTSVGRGDVDFAAFAAGLREIGFDGFTVYELVDAEDPVPRLADDLRALEGYGWT